MAAFVVWIGATLEVDYLEAAEHWKLKFWLVCLLYIGERKKEEHLGMTSFNKQIVKHNECIKNAIYFSNPLCVHQKFENLLQLTYRMSPLSLPTILVRLNKLYAGKCFSSVMVTKLAWNTKKLHSNLKQKWNTMCIVLVHAWLLNTYTNLLQTGTKINFLLKMSIRLVNVDAAWYLSLSLQEM